MIDAKYQFTHQGKTYAVYGTKTWLCDGLAISSNVMLEYRPARLWYHLLAIGVGCGLLDWALAAMIDAVRMGVLITPLWTIQCLVLAIISLCDLRTRWVLIAREYVRDSLEINGVAGDSSQFTSELIAEINQARAANTAFNLTQWKV